MRRLNRTRSAKQVNVSTKAQLQVTVEGSRERVLIPVVVKTVGYRMARVRLPWGVEFTPDTEKGEMLSLAGTPFSYAALYNEQYVAQEAADKKARKGRK